MARIIVTNNNWDKARAELKTNLEAQNASFNARLKATFAPPAPAAAAQATAKPKSGKPNESSLSRSRIRG